MQFSFLPDGGETGSVRHRRMITHTGDRIIETTESRIADEPLISTVTTEDATDGDVVEEVAVVTRQKSRRVKKSQKRPLDRKQKAVW